MNNDQIQQRIREILQARYKDLHEKFSAVITNASYDDVDRMVMRAVTRAETAIGQLQPAADPLLFLQQTVANLRQAQADFEEFYEDPLCFGTGTFLDIIFGVEALIKEVAASKTTASSQTTDAEVDSEEAKAYRKGNADYLSLGVREVAYNPPPGHEQAYQKGWEDRRSEEDEILLREWSG